MASVRCGCFLGVLSSPPPAVRIETLYLQLVMTYLWQEERNSNWYVLQLPTLDGLKGVQHIVQTYLDGVMSNLLPGERGTVASVLQYLVTRSGTKIAYPVLDLAGEVALDAAVTQGHNLPLCTLRSPCWSAGLPAGRARSPGCRSSLLLGAGTRQASSSQLDTDERCV
jgi:hypothetical protein